jgi:hypothetical protein
MFNLYLLQDSIDPKKIYIEPRDNFYFTNVVLDWSNKLDISKDIDQLPIVDRKKRVLLSYKEDKDFFNADKTTESSGMADFTYMINSYNRFLLKLTLAIHSNCGFVNYDVEANDQLSKLLEQMDVLNFNIE